MASLSWMRVALLGLLAVTNAAEVGKEYVYDYKGVMKFYNSEMPMQTTGIGFKSKVIMQPKADMKFAIKIQDMEMDIINTDNMDWETYEFQYKKDETAKIFDTEEVEKPFVVAVKDKKVDHMLTAPGEAIWATNLKKGLATMVTFYLPDNDDHIYQTMENGVSGECMSHYSVVHRPHYTNEEASVFNISKVVNFEKCTRIANKLYGFLQASPCVNCEALSTHPLISTARYDFNLYSPDKGRKNLILEHVHGMSDVIHTPYTTNGKVTKLKLDRTLDLVETRDASAMDLEGTTEVHKQLMMKLIKDDRYKRAIDMKKANDFVGINNLVVDEERVKKNFAELAGLQMEQNEMVGVLHKKDPALTFHLLFEDVIKMDYEQTEQFFKTNVGGADATKKMAYMSAFVDIVASAGHNAGVKFIIDKFESGEIDPKFMRNFLKGVRRSLKEPTEGGLNTLWDFCSTEIMKTQPTTRMQCMLTYTAIVDETCRLQSVHPLLGEEECKDQKLQDEVMAKVIPEYSVAVKEPCFMQSAYIHMAGNLKTKNAATWLNQLIRDKENQPPHRRLNAMWALNKASHKHASIVSPMAAQVYLDTREAYELRIAAVIAIMKTNPPLALLTAIADGLQTEKSDQVRSYVTSIFKEFADTKYPCFRELARHIQYLMPKLKHTMKKEMMQKDWLTSHMHLSSGYDEKYDIGGYSMASMIAGENSYLPRSLYVATGNYLAGFNYDSMSISYQGWGLDKVLDQFKNPRKGVKYGRNLWNYFGRRRVARDVEVNKKENDEIGEKLSIRTRDYEPIYGEVKASLFGHDIEIMKFNESTFEPMMKPGYKPGTMLNRILSTDRDDHRFYMARDLCFTVASEMGFPVFIDIRQPSVVSYKRQESSFDMGDDGLMNLKLNRHVMYDSHLYESFSFGMPFEKLFIGVGFDKRIGLNLPLKLAASANMITGKLTMNKALQLPRDLMHYHFTPFTFVEPWDKSIVIPAEKQMIPMYRPAELHKFKHELGEKAIGVKMTIEGTRLPNNLAFESWRRWYFESDCRAKLYYLIANPEWHPRTVDITIEPAAENPTSERTFEMAYKFATPETEKRPGSKFEEWKEDLPKSYVHVINMESDFKGPKERKITAEMRYSFTENNLDHQFQMFYDRTPFMDTEKDHMKMCMVSNIKMPRMRFERLSDIATFNDGHTVDVQTDIKYGKNCVKDAEIHANIKYEHSEDQLEWLKDLKSDEVKNRLVKNPYKKYYKKCIEWQAKGLEFPFACHMFVVKTSQLNKMTVDIGMDNVKLHEIPMAATMYTRLRSRYYPFLIQYDPSKPSAAGRIHMVTRVRDPCYGKRLVDVEFQGPKYSSTYSGIPVSKGAHLAPKTVLYMGMTNLMSYNKKFYHRVCDNQLNSIRTFDSVIFEMPETTCYKVMARDCSPHKLFTLLVADIAEKKKAIKLYLDDQKIEMVPGADNQIAVKMNGADIVVPDGEVKRINNERGIELLRMKNSGGWYSIVSNVYGIAIEYGGNSIYVQVAPFYRGKICGLCGDYNLDKQHEWHAADQCHYKTAHSFSRTYMLDDGTCNMPLPDANAGTPHCTTKK